VADITESAGLVDAWIRAKAEQAKWQQVVKALEERITEALDGDTVGEVDGKPVITNKTKITHRLDVAALREKEPEIADRFTIEREERAGMKAVGS
jgi:hypothetical protein